VEARLNMHGNNWWRTALWALGPIVLAAGVIAFFAVRWTDDSTPKSTGALPAVPEAPAAPKVDQTIDPTAKSVADKFIATAVARQNTGESWALLDPAYMGKDEYTQASWSKGDIPVIPYPADADRARYRVTGRQGNLLILEVGLFPKKGDTTQPATFDLWLKKHGARWLVEYWNTAYTPPVRSIDQ
jgi:hypothetical protein